MSSHVAEADRYLKTQQQDNDTGGETHTHSTVQQIYNVQLQQRLQTGYHHATV